MMFFSAILVQFEKNCNTSFRHTKNVFRSQFSCLRSFSYCSPKICTTKFNIMYPIFPQASFSKCLARSSILTPYTHSFGFTPVRFNSIFSRIGRFLSPKSPVTEVPHSPERISLAKRMKLAYKTYGKTLIVVHIVTTGFWIGSAYLLLA